MKKFLIITTVISSLVCTKSYAGEFYISPTVSLTNVETRLVKGVGDAEVDRVDASTNTVSFGAEAGYRFEIGKFFIGPELYYYNYNATIKDYENINNPALSDLDEIVAKDTYGLALNLGYRFTKKFAVYTRLGTGTANYDTTWYNWDNTEVETDNARHSASLSSVGAWYDINENVALKVAYDVVNYDTRGMFFDLFGLPEDSFDITIKSLSVGAIFKF